MNRVKDSSGSFLNLEKILLCIKKIVLEKIEENNDSFLHTIPERKKARHSKGKSPSNRYFK